MGKRVLFSVFLLSSILLSVSAQKPLSPSPASQGQPRNEDQDVVRITTNLVQVDVVVTRDGKQVTDLKPEDFELFEDGRPQQITSFSYISNVPGTASSNASPPAPKDKTAPIIPAAVRPNDTRRTVAFVVDDLGMSNESVVQARHQLRKFVDEQLQPNDLVAIIRTGGDVGALQQFTNDKRLLYSAIEHLKWNHCSRTGLNTFRPILHYPLNTLGNDLCGGQTLIGSLEALRFVVRGMGALPGRKAMMVLSDYIPFAEQEPGPNAGLPGNQRPGTQTSGGSGTGENTIPVGFDNPTSYEGFLRRIAELAIRSSVVIYAVDTRGLQYTGPTAADASSWDRYSLMHQTNDIISTRNMTLWTGREGSDLMARQTGGFLMRNTNDFGIDRVMDDQKGYYLIGYRPNDQTFNRHFHQIKARVKQKGLTLRTRTGFFGVTEDEARRPELTSDDQMRLALISPFGGSDINLRLTTFFANDATAGSLLRSFLYLDVSDLTFTEKPDGMHEATFALSSVVFGDNGRDLSRQDRSTTIRLTSESYQRAQREGLVYSFDTPVKRYGTFQFRVAVRDQISKRIGAAGQFVEVPNLRQDRLALSGIVIHNDENLQAQTSSNELEKAGEGGITGGPAVRKFHQGANLIAVSAVYNALVDKTTHLPQLTAQTRIFRDGKLLFTGDPMPLSVQGQTDLQRLIANVRLQVRPELPPGDYVLQIIVDDHLGKEKTRRASQWIDFEVVR
jgi:VWFA-related protein